jgi:hypothetical protein
MPTSCHFSKLPNPEIKMKIHAGKHKQEIYKKLCTPQTQLTKYIKENCMHLYHKRPDNFRYICIYIYIYTHTHTHKHAYNRPSTTAEIACAIRERHLKTISNLTYIHYHGISDTQTSYIRMHNRPYTSAETACVNQEKRPRHANKTVSDPRTNLGRPL